MPNEAVAFKNMFKTLKLVLNNYTMFSLIYAVIMSIRLVIQFFTRGTIEISEFMQMTSFLFALLYHHPF